MESLWSWVVEYVSRLGEYAGFLVLTGAMLSAIGAYFVLFQQNKFERDMREKAEQNLQQTQATLEHTQEAIRQITGGDSYCYFAPVRAPATNSLPVIIAVQGKYPLYDVIAEIHKRDSSGQGKPPATGERRLSPGRSVTLGTLSPKYDRRLPKPWDVGEGDSHHYRINFFARNGIFGQVLTIRAVNGVWVSASRVERDRKVIPGSERIANDFPRDEHGQVQW